MKTLIYKTNLIVALILLVTGCVSNQANPMVGLDAVFWHQKSQEYGGVTESLYYGAQAKLDAAISDSKRTASVEQLKMGAPYPEKMSIILDIDETVLNNSPLYARVVKNPDYDMGKGWSEWTAQGKAKALAGSVDFIKYALQKGVSVFFVSNRSCTQDEATIRNMKQVGFPVDNPDLYFISNNSEYGNPFAYDSCPKMEALVKNLLGVNDPKFASYKWARRSAIAKKYRILMLFGDSQGDLYSPPPGDGTSKEEEKRFMLAHLTPEERDGIVNSYGSFFKDRWVQLPNSMYGNWLDSYNDYSHVTAAEDAAKLDSGYATPE